MKYMGIQNKYIRIQKSAWKYTHIDKHNCVDEENDGRRRVSKLMMFITVMSAWSARTLRITTFTYVYRVLLTERGGACCRLADVKCHLETEFPCIRNLRLNPCNRNRWTPPRDVTSTYRYVTPLGWHIRIWVCTNASHSQYRRSAPSDRKAIYGI